MKSLKSYALSFLAGHLYALGFPSYLGESLLVTPIIAMAILFSVWFQEESLKAKVVTYLCFTLSFTLSSFYWIAATLSEFGELPLWLGIILNALFAFIIIPWMWLIQILFGIFQKKKISLKPFLENRLFVPSMAFLITSFEYFIPQQFPTHIAGPWIYLSEYLSFADIGGLPLYSFMSYLLVFLIVQKWVTKRFFPLSLIVVIIFIASHPFIPTAKTESVFPLKVRLVQANISNYLKVSSESGEYASVFQVVEKYKDLSLQKNEFDEKIDLIIWPETAYPYSLNSQEGYVPHLFQNIMDEMQTELFIGGYDEKGTFGSFYESEYNAGFLMGEGEIKDVYHKRVLIPFGETLPLGPFTEYASRFFGNIAFFARGESFPLIELKNKAKFIGAICYEILKPEYIRSYLNHLEKRPNFILNITNDSWYGDTLEPHQHLFLSRWRAIEFRLPIVRSTNTGISAIIDAEGKITHSLGVFKTGNLDAIFNAAIKEKTIYERFGFFSIIPLFFLLFIFELTMLKLKHEK